jgi:hypothetical protein
MPRKFRYRSRVYEEIPTQAPKFRVGDRVHEFGDPEIGTVEFFRRDGRACIRWGGGTREWLHQDSLCGPLAP